MRIFMNKEFRRWAAGLGLSNCVLVNAVNELENGLYEAHLGGKIYKKRIAIEGKGKRGGVRTIIAFKEREKAFFIYGFAKNVQSNISEREEFALKALAKIYFSYTQDEIAIAKKTSQLFEVNG